MNHSLPPRRSLSNFVKPSLQVHRTGDARDNRKQLAMVAGAYDSARLGRAVEMSEYRNTRVPQ